ncbi:MAG: hypothetical protein ACLTYN_07470 [Dysosmobacter welbionis]
MSHTDVSYLVSEAFRCSHLAGFATYNGEITPLWRTSCGIWPATVSGPFRGPDRERHLGAPLRDADDRSGGDERDAGDGGTVTLKSSVKEAQRRGWSPADAIADELLH